MKDEDIWRELRRHGLMTKSERIREQSEFCDRVRKRIKDKYPNCCDYWRGMSVAKDTRKLVRKISGLYRGYYDKLLYCPECGKAL